MIFIVLAIIIVITIKILINRYSKKNNLLEYLNNVPNKDSVPIEIIIIVLLLFIIRISIFSKFEWFSLEALYIFISLGILNVFLTIFIVDFFYAKRYKNNNYPLDKLKKIVRQEKIASKTKKQKNKNKITTWEIMSAIGSGISSARKDIKNEKLEKEMDYNYLNDYEKELVRKGDYDPTNFEYPENDEELGEDDFYSDDESWKD